MEMEDENEEAQLRAYIKDFNKWIGKAWQDSGKAGKIWICLLFLGMAAPFIFELLAAIVVIIWVWPLSVTLYDKLAILGFLFILFEAMALKIASYSLSTIFVSFAIRQIRKKRKTPPRESSG